MEQWVSEPEVDNDAVRDATGREWNDWLAVIDNGPGRDAGHPAIAAWLETDMGLDLWWSQTVTVGYERITGLRLAHQMPDGTFTANKSKTISADATKLDRVLRDERHFAMLFPGQVATLCSRPDAKAIRIEMSSGVAALSLTEKPDDRTAITIGHAKLPTFDDVETWKTYWSAWLDTLAERLADV